MGYSIEFKGQFWLNTPLSEAHRAYLQKFGGTRRMKRNVSKLTTVPDPIREAVGLPLGPEGAYYVGSNAQLGQDFDHPSAPPPQPHLEPLDPGQRKPSRLWRDC